MPLPAVSSTIEQNGLGVAQAAPSAHVKLGTCSLGTPNVLYAATDPTQTKKDMGSGPLVASANWALENVGGPVYLVKVAASNAGTNGAVTRTGTGPSPGAAPALTPLDDYDVIVEMIAGGAVGTATFRASFDNGKNWSPVFATAATVTSFAAVTGLNITFAAGTYVALDRYTWSSRGPTYSSGDLNTALDALRPLATLYRFIHVVGTTGGVDDPTKVTNFLSLATAINSKMQTFQSKARYTRALLEAPDVAASALNVAGVANFVGDRVGFAAGYAKLINAADKRIDRRHAATVVAGWKSKVDVHESAGNVGRGAIPGIDSLEYDENLSPLLDDLHVITLRTNPQAAGFYITNDWLKAAAGSDFEMWPNGTVIDLAVATAERYLVRYLNSPVYVSQKTGRILESQARFIENGCKAIVAAVLKAPTSGDPQPGSSASGVSVQVVRTTNILSTRRLAVILRLIPVGMSSFVDLNAGLENPLLRLTA